jgi:Fe-S cluster biogenesis protein NfuA
VEKDDLKGALAAVVAPLIEADGGELFLVPARGRLVHLHLRGRFSGCPGNPLVAEHVLRPVVEAADPAAKIQVTSGALLPEGAERILPAPGKSSGSRAESPRAEPDATDQASR